MDREKRRIRRIGGGYIQDTPAYHRRVLWGLSRCVKANVFDAVAIIEYEI